VTDKLKYDDLKQFKYRVLEVFTMETDIFSEVPIETTFSCLDIDGMITIYPGFCWDGATGALDTNNIMRGSCVHDAFCNWHDQGMLTLEHRKKADELLEKIIKEDGMSDFRAGYVYGAVQAWVKLRYQMLD